MYLLKRFLLAQDWAVKRFNRKIECEDDDKTQERKTNKQNKPLKLDLDQLYNMEDYMRIFESSIGNQPTVKVKEILAEHDYNFYGDPKTSKTSKTSKKSEKMVQMSENDSESFNYSSISQAFSSDEDKADNTMNRLADHFDFFHLEKSEFICDVVKICHSTMFVIAPKDDRYEGFFSKMNKDFQKGAETYNKVKVIEENMVYAVYNKSYKLWNRAIVLECDPESDRCTVCYADYAEEMTVYKNNIRELPSIFQSLPLRIVPVRLFGIKRHRRLRESDCKNRLKDLLDNNTLYCKVEKEEDGYLEAEVSLYEDKESTEVFYQPMIDACYYTKTVPPNPTKK